MIDSNELMALKMLKVLRSTALGELAKEESITDHSKIDALIRYHQAVQAAEATLKDEPRESPYETGRTISPTG
jgi:hypothetical protein